MKSIECKVCGKVIEGYTDRHVNFLLGQHSHTHLSDDEIKGELPPSVVEGDVSNSTDEELL